ncbi:hypothetical protein Tco_0573882 [Tanacetum coccineum]
MILGKPFMKETGLVYDKDEGDVKFEKYKEKITFKMPHKMERFKHIDKDILKTDNIPPIIITGDDGDHEKTYYSNSLNLEPAYRRDKSVTEAIQCLIKMKSRVDEGGFMFYEVLLQEITHRIAGSIFFQENKCEFFTVFGDGVRIFPDGVTSLEL